MSLGMPELLVIFVIILLIFGAGRLAGLGKGLGQAIRGFKDEVTTNDEEDEERQQKARRP
jgi:sec-independent protein translocase protein TatA